MDIVLWKPGCSYEPTKSEVDGEWEDSVTLRPNLTKSATLGRVGKTIQRTLSTCIWLQGAGSRNQ